MGCVSSLVDQSNSYTKKEEEETVKSSKYDLFEILIVNIKRIIRRLTDKMRGDYDKLTERERNPRHGRWTRDWSWPSPGPLYESKLWLEPALVPASLLYSASFSSLSSARNS